MATKYNAPGSPKRPQASRAKTKHSVAAKRYARTEAKARCRVPNENDHKYPHEVCGETEIRFRN